MTTVGGGAVAGGVDARPDVAKRVWRVRPSLPVVEQVPVNVSSAETSRLAQLAAAIRDADPALVMDLAPAGGPVRQGAGDGPALIFEDHGEIPLFTATAPSPLEYRSLLLAGDDDVFAVGGTRNTDFEAYARDGLRLGDVDVLPRPAGTTGLLPDALRRDPASMAKLVRLARARGGFTVIPFLSTLAAWQLAAAIADEADVEVSVLAPPPALAARVNDKSWFSRRVAEVLGPDAVPETGWAGDAFELTNALHILAKRHRRLVVKMPDSAGGVGNVVLESEDVAGLDHDALLAHVWDRTGRAGRGWTFPLLVGAWDDPVVDSPSVQLWVPPRGDGPPVVEGRWGGVSIALTAANRLTGDWARRPFVIVQRSRLKMPPRPLPAVLDEMGPLAFRTGEGRTGERRARPLPPGRGHRHEPHGTGQRRRRRRSRRRLGQGPPPRNR